MTAEGMYPSLFMTAFTANSDRTLSLCWEQHCKLLPGVAGVHANQVASWNIDEVILTSVNCVDIPWFTS